MKGEIRHPAKLLCTGSYSVAVECDGWVFVSGHTAQNLATAAVIDGTVAGETRLALSHMGTVLAQAGCTFGDVVKCKCHLADINDFEAFDNAYREFFTGVNPARTTVQSVLGERIRWKPTRLRVCRAGNRSLWHQGV